MKTPALLAACCLSTACASIVSDSQYPVTFTTEPPGADMRISDEAGAVIYNGKSPTSMVLQASDGYFNKARYTVEASIDGGPMSSGMLSPRLDGWYWGNLIFGGIIGMLIVDPATGSMYKLEDTFRLDVQAPPEPLLSELD